MHLKPNHAYLSSVGYHIILPLLFDNMNNLNWLTATVCLLLQTSILVYLLFVYVCIRLNLNLTNDNYSLYLLLLLYSACVVLF